MATIFTKIAKGEIPSYKVAENEDFYAFLDINPLVRGHVLVIPRNVEDDYIFNLEDKLYQDFWRFSKKVAVAIEKTIECKRVGVCVLGLEVAHAHIHLIPLNEESDLDFRKERPQFTEQEFKDTANAIFEAFNEIKG